MGIRAVGIRAILALAIMLAGGTAASRGPVAAAAVRPATVPATGTVTVPAAGTATEPPAGPVAVPPYNPVMGGKIVAEAIQVVAGGWPWQFGCAVSGSCVPYSWGGGHGPNPGPSEGICGDGWGLPSPAAPKDLYDGPQCAAAHNANGAPNGTYGMDCSGFTRWIYYLAYGTDVLGQTTTSTQPHRPGMVQVPAASREPGDLLLYPGHIGIYFGDYTSRSGARLPGIINELHAYDQKPKTTGTHLTDWTLSYAQASDVSAATAATATYWRYVGNQSPAA
jgi:hypothetical protein